MPEFNLTSNPQIGPTVCALCGTHTYPLIDTTVEIYGHGRVYICDQPDKNDHRAGCAEQIARAIHYVSPDGYQDLKEQLANTEAQLDQALAELNVRRDEENQYVLVDIETLKAELAPKKRTRR